MSHFSASGSTGKEAIISLRSLSHEVCVAVSQPEYWQQLRKDSNVTISISGKYVPVELESICNEDEYPRLQLMIQSQHEKDNKMFEIIRTRIHYDMMGLENNDRPVYDFNNHQMIVFGSIFNSLPITIFDAERSLLGQRNCNIKKIRNTLSCSIAVEQPMSQRYRFIIQHEKQTIMDLAVIQLQALIKQTQNHYLMTFAMMMGRLLVGPIVNIELMESTSSCDPDSYPSFTPFQPNVKRKRDDDRDQKVSTKQPVFDSDQSDDETNASDERRYKTGDFETTVKLTNSPSWDESDEIASHLTPLLDRLFLIEL